MSEQQAIDALRVKLAQAAADDGFSGAVAIAKNGKVLFASAYGYADRDKKIANTVETKFRIGSMNKMFTAVTVAQLVQAGKIEYGDVIGKYLKDYPNENVAAKVTVAELLTHTAGMGNIFGPEFDARRLELRDLKDYVALYGKREPEFVPGSRYAYSNYGYILLGLLVEAASGENYYDYVREHIFRPAEMTSTDSLPEDDDVPQRSVGYMGAERKPNYDTLPYRGTSAGGGYSTVGDLVRFAAALTSNRLLNAQNTKFITTGKIPAGPGLEYGYGFGEETVAGVRYFGHSGGAPGMNGRLMIFPKSGYIVVSLSNLDPPAAQSPAMFVAERLPAQ